GALDAWRLAFPASEQASSPIAHLRTRFARRNVMKIVLAVLIGYIAGIILASIAAFVFEFEDAARFIAIGCGVLGAVLGIPVAARREKNQSKDGGRGPHGSTTP